MNETDKVSEKNWKWVHNKIFTFLFVVLTFIIGVPSVMKGDEVAVWLWAFCIFTLVSYATLLSYLYPSRCIECKKKLNSSPLIIDYDI
jgi:hypothetical protein